MVDMVRVGPIVKSLLLALVIAVIGGGCGGIAATPAVSPLMFLLPGLGQNRPAPSTNAQPAQVAGDLARIN
jgi:hypothetical protein